MADELRLISAAVIAPAEALEIVRPLLGAEPVDGGLARDRHRLTAYARGVDHDDAETVTDYGVPDARLMLVVRFTPTADNSPPDDPHGDNTLRDILTTVLALIRTTAADAVLTCTDDIVLRHHGGRTALEPTWPGWTEIPTLRDIPAQHRTNTTNHPRDDPPADP